LYVLAERDGTTISGIAVNSAGQSPLRHRFETYSDDGHLSADMFFTRTDRTTGKELVRINYSVKVYNNLRSNSAYVSFYVPQAEHTLALCYFLAANWRNIAEKMRGGIEIELTAPGMVDSKKLSGNPLSGTVYVFHESILTMRELVELTDAFKEHGAEVVFYGSFTSLPAAPPQAPAPPAPQGTK